MAMVKLEPSPGSAQGWVTEGGYAWVNVSCILMIQPKEGMTTSKGGIHHDVCQVVLQFADDREVWLCIGSAERLAEYVTLQERSTYAAD